ncbi:MAG: hypothetical protein AAGJ35_05920, partial [Myxococcota bacterium]
MTSKNLHPQPIQQPHPPPRGHLYTQAKCIVEHLHSVGYEAFLVGGCVRDLLLGIPPKDYDITTNALPEQIEQIFSTLGYYTTDVGKNFGTIMVVKQKNPFEVTTFRAEGRYIDGRRPSQVRFHNVHVYDDVQRRDLTINGLLYDPQIEMVLDFTGGIDDLRSQIIRTIGDPF